MKTKENCSKKIKTGKLQQKKIKTKKKLKRNNCRKIFKKIKLIQKKLRNKYGIKGQKKKV